MIELSYDDKLIRKYRLALKKNPADTATNQCVPDPIRISSGTLTVTATDLATQVPDGTSNGTGMPAL